MNTVAAVVLAAGSSSRLGTPKQLLTFEGTSLLRRATKAATIAGCDPVVVVLGSNESQLRGEFNDLPAISVVNAQWQHGIGTSIRAGLSSTLHCNPEIAAVVLLVCDQPLIDGDVVRALIARYRSSAKPIVAAQYGATIGVPALFDHSIFDELCALPNESGAKPVIVSNPERVAVYPFPNGAIDIDSTADYERFSARRASSSPEGTSSVAPP